MDDQQDQAAYCLAEALRLVDVGYQLTPVTIRRAPNGRDKLASFHEKWQRQPVKAWSSDPDRIREWHAKHPDTSFAVRTGATGGVDVVDLDEKPGCSGAAWWTARGADMGSMVVETISGGLHIYGQPCGLPTSARAHIAVDTRGDGGVVYAPGAYIVGEQGSYRVQGEPVGPADLKPFDEEVSAWLIANPKTVHPDQPEKPRAEQRAESRLKRAQPADRPFSRAQATEHIERFALKRLREATEGGRNQQLNDSAMTMGHFASAFAFGLDEVVEKLEPIALEIGLAADEILPTIRSGFEAGVEDRPDRHGKRFGQVVRTDEPAAVHRRHLEFQTFAELAAEVDAAGPPQWLVRGVITTDQYGVLGGESKSQKTWNALDLAVAVASGTPWLCSIPVDTSGPVIVFVGEGGKRNTVRRIRAIAKAHGVRAEDLPIHVCVRAPKLGDVVHMAELAEKVAAIRPALVVLDPLYLSASGADKGDLYGMGELLERPQHVCQEHGSALLVVHHLNRQAGTGRARLSGAGPAEWGRFLIIVTVHESGTFEENKRSRVVAFLDIVGGEIPDQTYCVERYVWSDDPDDLASPMHVSVSARAVDQAEPGTADTSDADESARLAALDERVLAAAVEMAAKGFEVSKTRLEAAATGRAAEIRRAVDRLALSGRLIESRGTRGQIFTPTPSQDQQSDPVP